MAEDNNRRALHAYVSENAHESWHGFAADQGVSVSAILEALAPELGRDEASSSAQFAEVVRSARKIDASRRRRRRD